jgi:phosphoribosyl 1,2-cyclic phosphate phosphodiesterase
MAPGTPVTVTGAGGPLSVTPFRQLHGDIESLGLRVGSLAYSADVSGVPEASLPYLEGLDVWIVDALRYKPHPSHFSVSEAIDWSRRFGVRRAVLTHMHIDLDYATLKRELPEGVEPAYDGLTIELPLD